MRRRVLRPLLFPIVVASAALASAQCGLLGAPGDYTGGAPAEGADASVEGGAGDATTATDGTVVLPDGYVVPESIGTIAVVAGEREPTSAEDDPAWTADAWTGVLGADGRVATWKIDKSAPIIGSFDSAGLIGGSWFMLNIGFGLGGGRGTALQATSWGPGIVADWKATRANPPGGLDEHARLFIGGHVGFLGGTRTVAVDGGTNTFFTKEVHVADVDTTASTLGPSANTGIELVQARSRAGVVLADGHVYVVGGRFSGGITASVEKSDVDVAVGAFAPFAEQPAMTNAGADHKVFLPALAVANGYLYVAGGRINGTNAPTDVVLAGKIEKATGNVMGWQTVTKLPKPLRDFAFVGFKGRLYVLGGVTTGTPSRSADVYSATIAADGTLGAWDAANAKLPAPRSDFVSIAY